jgi:RNA polymerase sigma factor (sigma-70 family)
MTADIESAIEVRECMDCLTPRQREAVNLRADGYTYREIAWMMEISAPAVYYLVRRAKVRMNEEKNYLA